jgi:hypothetical protein
MVKFLAVIRIKPGYDPDETWKIWVNEHAPVSKKGLSPEVRKYTLHRVVKTLSDSDVFGVAEMLFDDVASAERAMKRNLSKPPDEFRKRIARVDRIILEGVEF